MYDHCHCHYQMEDPEVNCTLFGCDLYEPVLQVIYTSYAQLMGSRVHNKRREGEYPTLTIPCTNALHKVPSVNHRVLSFCINTLRETKGVLIGVNSAVLGIVDTR